MKIEQLTSQLNEQSVLLQTLSSQFNQLASNGNRGANAKADENNLNWCASSSSWDFDESLTAVMSPTQQPQIVPTKSRKILTDKNIIVAPPAFAPLVLNKIIKK